MTRMIRLIWFIMFFLRLASSRSFLRRNRCFTTSLRDSTVDETSITQTLYTLPKSLPLHVYVDADIRTFLQMRNAERKARILLPQEIEQGTLSIANLRDMIERKFPRLHGQPYQLRYQPPTDGELKTLLPRQFQSDEEVIRTILVASDTTPSLLQLFVEGIPGTFPPPGASQQYLQGMCDPSETDSYTMLSFYRFHDLEDPHAFAAQLQEIWRPFKAVGRVYVAQEGVNAQMAVPTNVLLPFKAACETLPLFQGLYLNTDHTLTKAAFEADRPFKALHVRVRDQIVADGFAAPLDWQRSGREMPPMEWHQALDNPQAVVLDCRNSYESDVGLFQGAVPLNTTFFRESWDALDETLKHTPKDAPLLTYCTGGIRCVKINAYLEQTLGFTNVNRLEGGIIAYTRELQKQQQQEAEAQAEVPGQGLGQADLPGVTRSEGSNSSSDDDSEVEMITASSSSSSPSLSSSSSYGPPISPQVHLTRDVAGSKFRGVNYVFDERMGARITGDVLSLCETCGAACDLFTNCNNYHCHVRFIQCDGCRGPASYAGCCSKACQADHAQSLSAESALREGSAAAQAAQRARKLMMGGVAGGGKGVGGNREMLVRKTAAVQPSTAPEGASAGARARTAAGGDGFDGGNSSVGPIAAVASTPTSSKSPPGVAVTANESEQPPLPLPRERRDHASALDAQVAALSTYCERHSAPEPPHLSALRLETTAVYRQAARMLSGPLQGRILTLLAAMKEPKHILELGTFTGYATLCLAEGQGLALGQGSVSVDTCDIDPLACDIAQRYFAASPWGPGITLHRNKRAHELLDDLRRAGDRAGTSGDSSEARASASAGPGPRLFDLVFIDADKKIYREYLQTLMGETESGTGTETESETGTEEGSVGQGEGEEESSRRRSGTSSGSGLCLLAEGALVIVDNTLWKGLVLAHGGEDLAGHTPEAHLYGNPDRLKVLAESMHDFNSWAAQHPCLLPVMIPLRDGLTIMRYSSQGKGK